MLDNLLGVCDRERELRDKANALADGADLTEAEAAEYQAIQDEQAARRV